MKIPIPGLRPLFNNAKAVTKVSLAVQPGDVLIVSDDVAAQLEGSDVAFQAYDADQVKALADAYAADAAAAAGASQADEATDTDEVTAKSTKDELVAYADAKGIDLGDANTKAEIVAVLFPAEG
jgi:hypothetical protein